MAAHNHSTGILIGLGTGVVVGLFLGERARFLSVIADAYIQLLRVSVLPYVTVALISGIGALSRAQAVVIATRVGAVVLTLWLLTLVLVFAMPLAFPHWETATFFSTALLEQPERFDFISLYIPASPFNSLANGVVPAVVLFSILLGGALVGVRDRDRLLDWLAVMCTALGNVASFMVSLAPIGLFAVAASLAGTLGAEEMQRVQVYLITYGVFSALLVLWVIPGLISAVTPIGFRDMFSRLRDAIVLAALTGELFVVLPMLADASRELVRRSSHDDTDATSMTDVIVPASFTFPHAGKILTLSFTLFAAWFSETALSWSARPLLAVSGLLVSFASVSAAIPYLLDLLRIPADTFHLFLATGLINSRVGTVVAAMHTVAVATIGALATSGHLTWTMRRLVRYAVVTTGLIAATIIGLQALFATPLHHPYLADRTLANMGLLLPGDQPANSPAATRSVLSSDGQLARIRARGTLRIAWIPESLPFAFRNDAGALVGLDVEMANCLARELEVRAEFVMLETEAMFRALETGDVDIAMSGLALTTLRAERVLFSTPYLDEHLAFVVEDYRRDEFVSIDRLRAQRRPRIAILNIPYYIDKMRELLPNAEVVVLTTRADLRRFFTAGPAPVEALALTAERGSSWTLLYPRFSVVIPRPEMLAIPLAYPLAAHDEALALFINNWLELKKRDGTIQQLYDYWILGKNAAPRQPRWSVIRDVLHWVD